jgi:hypothetical protein
VLLQKEVLLIGLIQILGILYINLIVLHGKKIVKILSILLQVKLLDKKINHKVLLFKKLRK